MESTSGKLNPSFITDPTSTPSDAGDEVFAYDAEGRRFETRDADETRRSVIDHRNPTGYSQKLDELKRDADAVGTPAEGWEIELGYTLGLDVIAQTRVEGSHLPELFLYDTHGSVRGLLDLQGKTRETYDYDAFGVAGQFYTLMVNPTQASDRSPMPLTQADAKSHLQYAGEFRTHSLGAYDLRARDYDAGTGRFRSQDPTIFGPGDTTDANLFLYGSANPVYYTDPTGWFVNNAELLTVSKIQFAALAIIGLSVLGIMAMGGAIINAGMRDAGSDQQTFASPKHVAKAMGVPTVSLQEESIKTVHKGNDDDMYFVHGTSTDRWRGGVINYFSATRKLDFGVGFYQFLADSDGLSAAANFARRNVRGDGHPFLIITSISRRRFNQIEKKQVSASSASDLAIVNQYRSSGIGPWDGIPIVYGATYKRDGLGGWIPHVQGTLPDQYRFNWLTGGDLKPFAIIPL